MDEDDLMLDGAVPIADLPNADVEPSTAETSRSRAQSLALGIGSAALLTAMATDALAVAGRHLGIVLLGSIEIVQASIVVAATAALVAATMLGAHARVHILIEKVRAPTARALDRFADAMSALVFAWLVAGSIWLAVDLWSGTEITEILHLPLRWLRIVWIFGALLIAFLFARNALKSGPR